MAARGFSTTPPGAILSVLLVSRCAPTGAEPKAMHCSHQAPLGQPHDREEELPAARMKSVKFSSQQQTLTSLEKGHKVVTVLEDMPQRPAKGMQTR